VVVCSAAGLVVVTERGVEVECAAEAGGGDVEESVFLG
jgi:hypothetical protein